MTLLLWLLGSVIYFVLMFLLGSVLGLNSLEGNSDRRAFARDAVPFDE